MGSAQTAGGCFACYCSCSPSLDVTHASCVSVRWPHRGSTRSAGLPHAQLRHPLPEPGRTGPQSEQIACLPCRVPAVVEVKRHQTIVLPCWTNKHFVDRRVPMFCRPVQQKSGQFCETGQFCTPSVLHGSLRSNRQKSFCIYTWLRLYHEHLRSLSF